ncbi:GntR family transcriptional regulator [Williamsia phyllosphaerae]|uniref:GntR family transcriptional regulator n=1 Tax=Williamsia phyllosphaerae TaxID=885042 RepID=A0ABQ1U6Q9_9NOCA|nr:GntR family transcriptional regulator [Williamsia phyllosphaerae]GGF11793.1 GntR family transcriptional regulator [Williamsia phyllosphaerae]
MPPTDRAPGVYDTLLERIVSWDLPPGAVLSEIELADQLSVSRTPIREALARLRRDGLVTQSAGRSAAVAAVSAETAVELYQAREALESYALMLVAQTRVHDTFSEYVDRYRQLAESTEIAAEDVYALSGEFDAAVRAACNNAYLSRLLKELSVHTARLRNLARDNQDRLRRSVTQRMEVVAAVARGDGPEAARLDSLRLADSLAVVIDELLGTTQQPPRSEPLGRNLR